MKKRNLFQISIIFLIFTVLFSLAPGVFADNDLHDHQDFSDSSESSEVGTFGDEDADVEDPDFEFLDDDENINPEDPNFEASDGDEEVDPQDPDFEVPDSEEEVDPQDPDFEVPDGEEEVDPEDPKFERPDNSQKPLDDDDDDDDEGRNVIELDPPLIEITDASFAVYDKDNNEVTDLLSIPRDAYLELMYAFAIIDLDPPVDEVKPGDYVEFSLPEVLTNAADFEPIIDFELRNDEGDLIGLLNISSDGIVRIDFSDEIDELSDVTFYFFINGEFVRDKIDDNSGGEFNLHEDGETITIGFEEETPPPDPISATITKTGSYNPSANEITWKIVVDPGDESLVNVRVVDTLGPNQTYKSSTPPYTSTTPPNIYVYEFAEISVPTTITIKTTPTGNFGQGTATFTNNADLFEEDGDEPLISDDDVVTVETKWVVKSGVARKDSVTGKNYIDWTIKLNNNALHTIPAGSTVTDTIPAFLAFVPGSVMLNGAAVAAPDTVSFANPLLTFTFGADAHGIQTLTFTTEVLDEYFDQQSQTGFKNTGTLNIGEDGFPGTSGTVGVGTSLLAKKGIGYDPATHLITWQLDVNKNGRTITNAVIVDTLGANQVFDAAFGVERDGVAMAASSYTYDSVAKTLTIALGNLSPTDKPVIVFKTRVTNPVDYANNKTTTYYNNKAVLSGGGITDSVVTNPSQSVKSTVIAKASTAYNYETRVISWRVTVNQNKMDMPNAIVTDTIPADQEYVTGSMLIDGVAPGTKLSVTGNVLTVTLGHISDQVVITFDTHVTDEDAFLKTNGDVTFTNKAKIESGIPGAPSPEVEAERKVTNKVVDKSLLTEFTKENGYIGWAVTINANQVNLVNTTLSDTLQSGLELDTESVELYYWNQDANGNHTVGALVPTGDYSFTYDAVTRLFEITLPDGPHGYYLTFNTDVVAPGKYSNTIKFDGAHSHEDSASSNVTIRASDLDWGASGRNGSIKIVKNDEEGTPLAGAVFQLLDSLGIVRATLTTDINGVAHFTNQKFRTYFLREVRAPLGFILDSTEIEVTLSNESEDTMHQTDTVVNIRLTAAVELYKENLDGAPLSGGLFGIYDISDTDFATPLKTSTSTNGVIRFEGLLPGDYNVREISAPTGYAVSDIAIPVSLILDEDENSLDDVTIEEPLVNERLVAAIQFLKVDTNGELLNGGSFGIYDPIDTAFANPLQTVAAVSGVVRFEGLLPGDYKIREISSPIGFTLSETVIDVSLVLNESENVLADVIITEHFVNEFLVADIELHKVNTDDELLSGGTFGIYDASDTDFNSPLQTVVAVNGIVRFVGLLPGIYNIREISAPIGYELSSAVIPVSLVLDEVENSLDDVIIQEPLVNERLVAAIQFLKIDTNDTLLNGGLFGIYDPIDTTFASPLQTAVALDGVVRFEDLLPGDYKIREIEAPIGYVLSDTVIDVSLVLDEVENVLADVIVGEPFVNEFLVANIELRKVDDKNKALSGGLFGIYEASDTGYTNPLQTTTSVDGIVRFEGLLPGIYNIREIKSPEGYHLTTTVVAVSLVLDEITNTLDDVMIELPLVNELIIGSIELKKVDSGGRLLAGAKFGLYNSSGHLVAEVISDINGIVRFNNVPYGVYVVKEITPPDGYEATQVSILVNLTKDGVTRTTPYEVVNKAKPKDSDTGGSKIPQTGSFWGTTTLLTLGSLLILTGGGLFTYLIYSKKKDQNKTL